MSQRYTLDQVGGADWVLFDRTKPFTNRGYLLFVIPIVNDKFNYQIILADWDAASVEHRHRKIYSEIYSNLFYSKVEWLGDLVTSFYTVLQDMEIDRPVEMAYLLGGIIGSEEVAIPQFEGSNLLLN